MKAAGAGLLACQECRADLGALRAEGEDGDDASASPIPPAAITGTSTASTIWGTERQRAREGILRGPEE
jgi:hypothetical protein